MGLAMPIPYQYSVGDVLTAALLNAQVYNGLTFLEQPPVFYGVQATAQTLLTSTNTAITLDTGIVDPYNGHSNTTNPSRYVNQVAGSYLLSGCVGYAGNATGFRNAAIRVNGTAVQGGVSEAASSSATFATTIASPTVLKFLNVGDYVEIWAWQTSGGNLNTTAFADQACSLTVYFAHS